MTCTFNVSAVKSSNALLHIKQYCFLDDIFLSDQFIPCTYTSVSEILLLPMIKCCVDVNGNEMKLLPNGAHAATRNR